MVFLFIFLILIFFILTLKIKIKIEKIEFSSQKIENRYLAPYYQIIFSFWLLGKVKIAQFSITKTKLEKIKLKEKIKKVDLSILENKNDFDQEFFRSLKKLKIKTKKIALEIQLGTENAALTAILVPVISTALSIFLQKSVEQFEEQEFKIQPVFLNQNTIKIRFEGIFEIKVIHIITTICIVNKKRRGDKHERTSNRGSYDYSYE